MAENPHVTVGRLVHYRLKTDDVSQINRRRTSSKEIQERVTAGTWTPGTQAHVGAPVVDGQIVPMLVVSTNSVPVASVNGQVFLDGNDVFWVQKAVEGTFPGMWSWPPREDGREAQTPQSP